MPRLCGLWILVSFVTLGCAGRNVPASPDAPRGSATANTATATRNASGGAALALTARDSVPVPGLGTRAQPVQAGGPFGEREFLRRLICPNGKAPSFVRTGSLPGGADSHILDGYTVTCPDTTLVVQIFMDMYHGPYRERRAVAPFTVLAELPARTATGCPPVVHADADSSARYLFNSLEVETPAKLIGTPPGVQQVGATGSVTLTFAIDRNGAPEPVFVAVTGTATLQDRAKELVLALRYEPAQHHVGCKVRQGMTVRISFR